jgi:hypothetical protein
VELIGQQARHAPLRWIPSAIAADGRLPGTGHRVHARGADKPFVTVTVTTPSGTTEYGDSFYSCNDDGRPTIDSDALDAAAQAFSQLAFPQS